MEIGASTSRPNLFDSLTTLARLNVRAPERSGDTGRVERTERAGERRPVDSVELSPAARAAQDEDESTTRRVDGRPEDRFTGTTAGSADEEKAPNGEQLTEEEQEKVSQLQSRDREVRAHEQAHKAAGGQYAGAISYDYTTGPDGRDYATGGSVPIDASAVPGDPEATIAKMQVVRRAALAPAQPSSQDRRVAAQASEKENRARAESAKLDAEDKKAQRDGETQEPGETRSGFGRKSEDRAIRVDEATGTYGLEPAQSFTTAPELDLVA